MTQPTDFIEQLTALAEKATPGPWEEEYDPIDDGDHPTAIYLPGRAGLPGTFIAYCQHNWNDAYAGERRISWKEAETNAALIVLLRNNVDATLALGRERDALRKLVTDLANEPPGGEVWERSRTFAEYSQRARQALEGDNQ